MSGVPDPNPAAWMDDNGHGTHTAGTIAAAKNGIGIVGVAPNVKIAGIKAGNADGFFFPEAVICAFMWAGTHDIEVTNNSYFADPWLFNCRNDAEQRAIWKAERRAITLRACQGVTVVAADGNQADDLAHPTPGRDQSRRHEPRLATDTQRLRRRAGRGPGRDRRDGATATCSSSRSTRATASARRRSSRPAATRSCSVPPRRRTAACCRPGPRRY